MRTIGIIGAGFSGTMAAAHLLRAGGVRVCLLDRTGAFGPGLAYSTRTAAHLLNVPVGRMSARPDVPEDFLHWGLAQGHNWAGGTFAPRREYGRYLQDALNAAEATGRGVLERMHGEAVAVRPVNGGLKIEWREAPAAVRDNGLREAMALTPAVRSVTVDAVLLALGNFPPAHPCRAVAGLPSGCYAADPWGPGALEGIDPTSPVLLVGTGLTMFDIVLSLVERGHRGPIHAVSRRGLLPQPHRAAVRPPASHAPPPGIETWPPTALGMLRAVRNEVRLAAKRGIDWREVITSLRPVTPRLWGALSERERARFLHHIRPFWEVVRHRSAPSVDGQIQELMLSGKLHIHAARISQASPTDAGVEVRLTPRGSEASRSVRVARIINCTGPDTDPARLNSPLVSQLVAERVAIADPLGQGLLTDEEGRLISDVGGVSDRVWLIGPMAKGSAWEITAVPELREHAARIARQLASVAPTAAAVQV